MDEPPIEAEVAIQPVVPLPTSRFSAPTPPPYVSPVTRMNVLRIALLVTAAVSVMAGLAAVQRQRFATEALRVGAVTPDRLDALAHRWAVIEFLLAAAAIAAGLAWLAWFVQAYGNLQRLGARWTSMSRSTAVVCCAVPVLNLFMAPKLWLEAWRWSESDSGAKRPTALLLAWPAVGLITVLLGVLGERTTDRDMGYLDPVRSAAPLQILAAVALLGSVLITLRLAEVLTVRQEAAAGHGATAEL